MEAVIFFFSFAGLAIVCDDHLGAPQPTRARPCAVARSKHALSRGDVRSRIPVRFLTRHRPPNCCAVGSLETLCVRWNIREDIAGASFMAFGSAAPEIIVNAVSTIKARGSPGPARLRAWCLCCGPNGHLLGQHMASMERAAHTRLPPQAVSGGAGGGGDPEAASLGVGAIIGSGIIAFSLIPGCCGLCVCPARDPVWRWLDPSCAALALRCPLRAIWTPISPRRAAPHPVWHSSGSLALRFTSNAGSSTHPSSHARQMVVRMTLLTT